MSTHRDFTANQPLPARERQPGAVVENADTPRKGCDSATAETDIAVFGPHRLASVELQRQHPFTRGQFRVIIREIKNQPAIEVMPDPLSLGTDDDIVPVIEFHQVCEFILVDERSNDLFAPFCLPRRLLAHLANSPPLAPFVIDEARHVWQFIFVADFVLVAANHPLVFCRCFGDAPRTILNSRVVGGVAAKREPQFEITDGAPLPDEKRVAGRHVLRCRFPVNNTLLHAPESRIAVPAGEILPVEEHLHAAGLRRRHCGGLVGGRFGKGGTGDKDEEEGQETAHWHALHGLLKNVPERSA